MLRLTVHCVAVTEHYLVFQAATKQIRLLRVYWDDLSAGLTSPFYQHEVTLQAGDDDDGDITIYQVTEWHAVHLRGRDITSEATYLRFVRDVLRHSFFLLLQRVSSALDHSQFFEWDIHRKGLSTTHTCDVEEWLAIASGPAKQYWERFVSAHTDTLSTGLATLKLTKQTVDVVGAPCPLFRVLHEWYQRPHIAGYLYNRLLEMEDLWQATTQNATLQLRLATLNTGAIYDLARLHRHLATLDSRQPYINLVRLLGVTLRGKLPLLLAQHCDGSEKAHPRVRQQLWEQVILRYLMEEVEARAASEHGSCAPVHFKQLLYFYHQLMGLACSDEEYNALLPFDLAAEPTWTTLTSCTLFDKRHHLEMLSVLRDVVTRATRLPRWEAATTEPTIVRLYTPLFVIHTRPQELECERECQTLWQDRTAWTKQITIYYPEEAAQWDVETWVSDHDALDDVDRQLYQTRFTLLYLTPSDLRQSRDLALLRRLWHQDFFRTSAVTIACSRHLFKRFCLYFHRKQDELTLDDARSHLYVVGAEAAVRDTLVVMDAHLLSNRQMVTLLQWIRDAGERVTRVVMMGAMDLSPLHTTGHAFLDLAQWHDSAGTRATLFSFKLHIDASHALLTDVTTSLHYVTLKLLQEQVKSMAKEYKAVSLLVLVAEEKRAHKWQPLLERVRQSLRPDFVDAYTVRLETVTLSELAFYDATVEHSKRLRLCLAQREEVVKMRRNELNHLLLMPERLCVLCDDAPPPSHQWLVKLIAKTLYPNVRHTLPFLQKTVSVTV